MKNIFLYLLLSIFFLHSFGNTTVSKNLDYVKNEGQWENPVLYKADLHGGWVFLKKD